MPDSSHSTDSDAAPCLSSDESRRRLLAERLLKYCSRLLPLCVAAFLIQDYIRNYLESVSKPWHGAAGFYELGVTYINTMYILAFFVLWFASAGLLWFCKVIVLGEVCE